MDSPSIQSNVPHIKDHGIPSGQRHMESSADWAWMANGPGEFQQTPPIQHNTGPILLFFLLVLFLILLIISLIILINIKNHFFYFIKKS